MVINKQDTPYEPLERFCKEKDLPVLARIPYDPRIAALSADGQIVAETDKDFRCLFDDLLRRIGGAV